MQVLVIGGGPAGIMAAGMAAEAGAKVYLVEKNDRPGRKLRITGKGRCNLTNNCTHEELIENTVVNGRFLHSAFRAFSNLDLMEFMEKLGVPLKTERGGRVFPESDKATDVVDALMRWLREKGVRIVKLKADSLIVREGKLCGVRFGDKGIRADAVVLATGGMSYPQTGSTGDGYKMAKDLGHTVVSARASLVPLVCEERFDLAGLSLKNITLSVCTEKGCVYEEFGEMLFTHDGISGPVVLSASAHMREPGPYKVAIDLKPALSREVLDKRLLRDFEKYARKDFLHALDDLLPKRLIDTVITRTGIPPHKKTGLITKAERAVILETLKHFTLTVTGFRPIAEAIVTSGGISVGEINPKTMESKKIPGLYFAGEIIDVDAYTGGFNLQIAFSTGASAGRAIGERVLLNEWE
ncbi:MAG: NAD(P)/FAD-dependent oxidoreductase [Ruminococcaceae bacterium]|nr:NAD(P)/FAD-dependent oxidoreductase [Oscillospiraceae bacterium]